MLMDKYFEAMKNVLAEIENTQRENIIKASNIVVESLTNGGMWHINDTGHMLMFEGVGRTGGMMALRPIIINCTIENPTRYRERLNGQTFTYDKIEGFSDFVLGQCNLRSGDVLIIGSVSGYNKLPIDMALKAREMGIKTIAITSVQYSEGLKSAHPSKLRLFEAVDVVLDNCSKFGDTLVNVPEINQEICPSSGIGSSYLMWALQSTIIEKLIEKGLNPSVYISRHMPNSDEINGTAKANYQKLGY
ncbi:MAG: sugar isomerase domain-containing protein [Candidatus Cloacimonetes bacterium]|nr:sugar isomerase domain-containing protein [Candidatus Cloacimonadota bacterium]